LTVTAGNSTNLGIQPFLCNRQFFSTKEYCQILEFSLSHVLKVVCLANLALNIFRADEAEESGLIHRSFSDSKGGGGIWRHPIGWDCGEEGLEERK
jgi:hypothetical protein